MGALPKIPTVINPQVMSLAAAVLGPLEDQNIPLGTDTPVIGFIIDEPRGMIRWIVRIRLRCP
jgi:hypothetical protein